ncbi:MAG: sigma-E processing peptidase SpoIIGA [Bacilli bacterium]|nr:sigma-E processing peptidase SpoIIGA [Bacilli bacterium]
MKIYLDLILLLNFIFDLLLLLTVSILLKRCAKFYKLFLGALMGSLSIFLLFINMNSFTLFFIKIIISIFMVIISFSFKNIKYTFNNILYLYTTSIILGGFLYLLNIQFSYKQIGLVFYHNGLSINFIFLIIFSPVILYIYMKQIKKLKNNYNNYYKLNIYYKNKKYELSSYLDTGNMLKSPYSNKPIIIINKNIIKDNNMEFVLIPIYTINNCNLLKCFKIREFEINKRKIKKDILVGISNQTINIDGIDCILNNYLMEEII